MKKDEKIAELEGQLARLGADFANFRRRTEEERSQLTKMAQVQTLLELAPVLDNFRRATTHLPDELQGNSWVTGVLYVEKQLEQILEGFGMTKIKTIGEQFDPKLHEAIESEESDKESNTVTAEVETGYMVGDHVLKPAKVKVSK